MSATRSKHSMAKHSRDEAAALFRDMLRIRRAEERIAEMVESGEVRCPCHLCIGQEGVAVGVCAALEEGDTVWGGHRSHGHYLARGGSLPGLFAEVLGRTEGCSGGRGGSMHLAAPEVGLYGTVPIVAATVPLAAGAAFAAKCAGKNRVAVVFFGDGATEEGHLHETLNLAALYRLPLLFVCENNQYSSHLHWSGRRLKDNLSEAGDFHGVPGERVDGNDVRAVQSAAAVAVNRARAGGGPFFLEARTFRWRGHVGPSWDMDVGVRRRDELSEWIARDPIARIEPEVEAAPTIRHEVEMEIEQALRIARQAPLPDANRVMEHVCGN